MNIAINTIYVKKMDSYSVPSESVVISVYSGEKQLNDDEYLVDYEKYTVSILSDDNNSNIKIFHINSKDSIIGYNNRSIYNIIGESSLESNCNYELYNSIKIEYLETKFSPVHCSVKDIKRVLGPILKYIDDDTDIERYIFDSSVEIDLMKLKDVDIKKLCTYKVAIDIAYHYYYIMLNNAGKKEDTVGTLKTVTEKKAIVLKDFIKRFSDVIDSMVAKKITESKNFVKANKSQSPLGSRLW